MKSIVQEASSVAKAIEQGWQKAGCPAQFSIKILELPEKNFFGFTVKSAKVALYFGEEGSTHRERQAAPRAKFSREQREPREQREQREPRERREQQRAPQREQRQEQERYAEQEQRFQSREQREPREQREQREPRERTQAAEGALSHEGRQAKRFEPLWNDDMIGAARHWLKNALKSVDRENVTFTIQPQQFHLKIVLSHPLVEDSEREKQLLASYSALMMETLRKEFKTGFRGHKIVITHA